MIIRDPHRSLCATFFERLLKENHLYPFGIHTILDVILTANKKLNWSLFQACNVTQLDNIIK